MENKSTSQHIRELLKIAWPVSLGQFGHIMTNVADTLMLGNYDSDHLSASGFAGGVFIFPFLLALGIGIGVTPLVANAVGAKDEASIPALLATALALYVPIGVVVGVGGLLSSNLLLYMGQDPDIAVLSTGYFEMLCLSVIPLMLYQAFKQFAEGLSQTTVAMVISIGGNLINILFNYLLIYGKYGFPELGLMGAAYATLGSRVLMSVAMFLYVWYHRSFQKYIRLFQWVSVTKQRLKELWKMSGPIGLQFMLEGGAFSIALVMVGWLGKQYIAAHNIALNLAAMSFILLTGLAQATTIKVGNNLGAKNYTQLRRVALLGIIMGMSFMGSCGVAFVFGNEWFPHFFVPADEVLILETASQLILIAALFQISDALQHMSMGALRGMQDVRIPTIISTIAYWFISLPVGALLAFYFELGVYGIWFGLTVGLTLSAIFFFARFLSLSKKYLTGSLDQGT